VSKIILLKKKKNKEAHSNKAEKKKHRYKTKHTQNVLKTNIANKKKKTTNDEFDFFIFVESMAVAFVFV